MRDAVDCPTEAAGHGTCGVATGARQQKSTGKQSVPFFRRSCLLCSTRTAYGIAPALCNFAVATYTRYVEAKLLFRGFFVFSIIVATYTRYVEAKNPSVAKPRTYWVATRARYVKAKANAGDGREQAAAATYTMCERVRNLHAVRGNWDKKHYY